MRGIAYPIGDSLYLNITNRCTNQCQFCIRYKSRLFNREHPLWLEREPTEEEILEAIGDPNKYKQIVFCGYGEPLIRLDVVKQVAKHLKLVIRHLSREKSRDSSFVIRIDTNGQADLFWGRNILPELKGLIDYISVSLDAENKEAYERLCFPAFGEKTYAAIIEFIKEAKKYIPVVEATVVDLPVIDKEACKKIADQLGVNFRIRPYYEETYIK